MNRVLICCIVITALLATATAKGQGVEQLALSSITSRRPEIAPQPAASEVEMSGKVGGGVSSPPSNAFGQGITVIGTLTVVTPNIPLPLLLDFSSTSFSGKQGFTSADLTAISVGARLGLTGDQKDPGLWLIGAVSYARGIATDYDTSNQTTSPWGAGSTFGAGLKLSKSFEIEIRAHTTQGTTWIPFTLNYRF